MTSFKTVTTINGHFVPPSKAVVSVFDNSLLYAEGLFETLLAVGDRPIFAAEHLARLNKGARLIRLPLPVTDDRLLKWMAATLRKHSSRVKKLRLTITGGESARWTGRAGKPSVILSASPHQIPRKPFRLLVSELKVDQQSVMRNIKTISYAISAAAIRQAKDLGFDDALLLNERDEIAEVTSANIFWVRSGQVFTPPLSAGCLEGVTRGQVFREAARLGLRLKEKSTSLKELWAADEIFISSSLKLVVGVAEIRAHRSARKFSEGPITRELVKRFNLLLGL